MLDTNFHIVTNVRSFFTVTPDPKPVFSISPILIEWMSTLLTILKNQIPPALQTKAQMAVASLIRSLTYVINLWASAC